MNQLPANLDILMQIRRRLDILLERLQNDQEQLTGGVAELDRAIAAVKQTASATAQAIERNQGL